MVSESTLTEVTNRLVSRFHPAKIILFGSQARGTADERSDVDLLVISEFTGSRRAIMVEMYRTLRDVACDIVLMRPQELDRDRTIPGTIARYASDEGKILYDSTQS
ncbi:MAG: nucleotidyltransferase domain-containing protein [Sedimentisphaerales bacterium]|nr:nucleotidyltransferase domain-containing protein [Sedimentisphaerales bacterium]